MTKPAGTPTTVDPMTPQAIDGYVEAVDPPEARLKMTADAAEVTGIRLLDAAMRAREQ